jgi:hypothetical protein
MGSARVCIHQYFKLTAMKANSHNSLFSRAIAALIIAVTFMGCERDLEELNPVAYSTDPYVFMDGFSGGLNYSGISGG